MIDPVTGLVVVKKKLPATLITRQGIHLLELKGLGMNYHAIRHVHRVCLLVRNKKFSNNNVLISMLLKEFADYELHGKDRVIIEQAVKHLNSMPPVR